tara:strand:+ start:114 stop:311 length:198 start_codon:yes stop_codon:yes gene_type:complete
MPFTGLYFASYEQSQKLMRKAFKMKKGEELSYYCHLSGAAASAGFAGALTNPLDVVKTRTQVRFL